MATGDRYLNLVEKRLLGHEQFDDYFLQALRKDFHDTTRWTYNSAGTFTILNLTGSGANEFDIIDFGTNICAIDGAGNFLNLYIRASDMRDIQFENANGVAYDVAIQKAEIPNGLFINPADGLPQFNTLEEVIGWQGEPDDVIDNGDGTLTFTIDELTEAGVSNAGRQAVVWKKQPGKEAVVIGMAMETCTIAYTTENKITTVGDFGQPSTSHSTNSADYYVTVLGPRVSRNVPLHAPQPDDWCFVATVTGAGAGNPPTIFDNSNQTVLTIPITDFSQATRYAANGWLKIDVKAMNTEIGEDQIRVTRLADGIKFRVDELGNTTIEGNFALNGSVVTDLVPDSGLRGLGTPALPFVEAHVTDGYFDTLDLNANAPTINVLHADGPAHSRKWSFDFSVDNEFAINALNDGETSSENVLESIRTSGSANIVSTIMDCDYFGIQNPSDKAELRLMSPANDPDEAVAYMSLEDDSRLDFGIIDGAMSKSLALRLFGTKALFPGTARIGGILDPEAGDALTIQGGNLSPHANCSQDLGALTRRWGSIYGDELNLGQGLASDLLPTTDVTLSLGSTSLRYLNVIGKYLEAIDGTAPQIRMRDWGEGIHDRNWIFTTYDKHLYLAPAEDDWTSLGSVMDISRGVGLGASVKFSGVQFEWDGGMMFPSGVNSDIGSPGQRWKDLYLSGLVACGGQGQFNSVQITGDPVWGVSNTTSLTNVINTSLSTGVGIIHLAKVGDEVNVGWIKLYVGTVAVWIPYWLML